MAEYDQIAGQYRDRVINLFNQYVRQYTYMQIIGDYSQQSILDLACGDGCSTRIFKPKAGRVVGVDISDQLIAFAKQEEQLSPVGIEYFTGDVVELDLLGVFDKVVAIQLLHYAQTEEQLLMMCRNIYANLKEGGRFITVNGNYALSDQDYAKLEKYGVPKTDDIGELEEGSAVAVTFTTNEGVKANFNVYYFSQATYEKNLSQAKFKEVRWHKAQVSPQGIEAYGEPFWQDAIDYPMDWFIECRK